VKSRRVILIIFVFLAMVSSAYAHPPSDIKITFDPQTKMLQAVIIHNVSNPVNHYIKKVDLGLNGKEIITQELSRQDNNESQTVHYFIPDAKAQDMLSVEGYCSISGKLEKEIKAQ
jgi:desulfoferrodoxin (superoxide reductase-like protein)